MSAVIRAEGLGRVFGGGHARVVALDSVSLQLDPGELVVLRGPSGAGKTTLVSLLAGLDAPTAGTVRIADGGGGEVELGRSSSTALDELRVRRLGVVFQSGALIPVLSAAENIALPLRIAKWDARARDERVRELLERVGLAPHAEQRPDELSGGQQQRVGIARAIAHRPAILLADEPTGQLDSATTASIMELIESLVRDDGVAALVTTHDPAVVARADRVLDLHDGRIVDGR